jgi:acetolactate synthase regulatory subunit
MNSVVYRHARSWGRPGRPLRLGVTSGSSRTARRAGGEALRARDLVLLGWLCEQYGARTDQLEVLLDSGPRTVQRVLARLRDTGLITTRRLLVGEPAWAIPTSAGLRAAGHGFVVWRPRIGLLAHVAAVNNVRLHVQARSPESEWVPERVLARERNPGEHLPDALVIAQGQRVAIEVELTVKSQRRARLILDELSERFDTVLYWCAPGPYRQLSQLAESGQWRSTKLGVRELPHPQAARVP